MTEDDGNDPVWVTNVELNRAVSHSRVSFYGIPRWEWIEESSSPMGVNNKTNSWKRISTWWIHIPDGKEWRDEFLERNKWRDSIPEWDWVKDPIPHSSTAVIWVGESTIELCRWESSVSNEPRITTKNIPDLARWMLGMDWGIQFPDGNGAGLRFPHSSTTSIRIGESNIEQRYGLENPFSSCVDENPKWSTTVVSWFRNDHDIPSDHRGCWERIKGSGSPMGMDHGIQFPHSSTTEIWIRESILDLFRWESNVIHYSG
jgi:hypothetical protein